MIKDYSNSDKNPIRIVISVLELVLLFAIVIGVPIYIYFCKPELLLLLKDKEAIENLLMEHPGKSIGIYLSLQIFQTVAGIIPAQPVQFAGGYAFPLWLGILLTIGGMIAGSILACLISKILGRRALYTIFGEAKMSKYLDKLNSKRAFIIVFVMYFIPGMPKDMFNYAIGISEMKMVPFLFTSLIARTPATLVTVLMGYAAKTGSYITLIVLLAVVTILFLLGFFFHKRFIAWLDRVYAEKFNIE